MQYQMNHIQHRQTQSQQWQQQAPAGERLGVNNVAQPVGKVEGAAPGMVGSQLCQGI